MKLANFLLFASLCGAQTLINLGGPAVSGYLPDASFCPTGTPYNVPAAVPAPIYQTERYGAFTCTVPLPNGTYPVTLDLIENRRASGQDGAVGVGVRLFSVSVNGVSTGQLDIFAAVGSLVPYQLKLTVPVTNGQMVFSWIAVAGKGNPVGSAIEIGAALPAVIPPLGVSEVPSGLLVVMADGSYRSVPLGAQLVYQNGRLAVALALPSVAQMFVYPQVVSQLAVCPGTPPPSEVCTGLTYIVLSNGASYFGEPPPVGFVPGSGWAPVTPVAQ